MIDILLAYNPIVSAYMIHALYLFREIIDLNMEK